MRIVELAAGLARAGCASPAQPRPTPMPAPRNVRAEIVAASIYGYELASCRNLARDRSRGDR